MASSAAEKTRLAARLANAGISDATLAGYFEGATAGTVQTIADAKIEAAITRMQGGQTSDISTLPRPGGSNELQNEAMMRWDYRRDPSRAARGELL